MKNKIELINRISELEAKVEAANKKLEKEIKAYSNNTMRPAIHDEFIMVLKNIKASIEIPRNREQNFLKPTVCAYKEDVPNCEVIDCNDCPHTMNPRKEKCRVGGVPQNVPSCKELKPEVFRDCQGYTSKIVKKENKQK